MTSNHKLAKSAIVRRAIFALSTLGLFAAGAAPAAADAGLKFAYQNSATTTCSGNFCTLDLPGVHRKFVLRVEKLNCLVESNQTATGAGTITMLGGPTQSYYEAKPVNGTNYLADAAPDLYVQNGVSLIRIVARMPTTPTRLSCVVSGDLTPADM